MKKTLILCVLLAWNTLYAYDWAGDGITVVDTVEADGKTELFLKDDKENSFSLSYFTDPGEPVFKNVVKLKNDFHNWKNMRPDSIKFVYERGGLEISVLPRTFKYDGKDVTKNLPSGMQFSFTHFLQYNFRLNVDKYFVRIAGEFETEDRVCKKIIDAIENPREYTRKRDPEYLLTRIERLEDTLNKVRTATLMLHNSGFLSSAAPIDKDLVERVVSLRIKDPVISREKIAETLEKEKVEASSREINLILNVYFNDFKK